MANVVESAGLTLTPGDNTQVKQALDVFMINRAPLYVEPRLTAAERADAESYLGAINIGAKVQALFAEAVAERRELRFGAGAFNLGNTTMNLETTGYTQGPIITGHGAGSASQDQGTILRSTRSSGAVLRLVKTSINSFYFGTVLEGFAIEGPAGLTTARGLEMVAHWGARLNELRLAKCQDGWYIGSGVGAGDLSTTVHLDARNVRCQYNTRFGGHFEAQNANAIPMANSEFYGCQFEVNGVGGLVADNAASVVFRGGSAVINGTNDLTHNGGIHFRKNGTVGTRSVWLDNVELGNNCHPWMVKYDHPISCGTNRSRWIQNSGETCPKGLVIGDGGSDVPNAFSSKNDVIINSNAALAFTMFDVAANATFVKLRDPWFSVWNAGNHTKVSDLARVME